MELAQMRLVFLAADAGEKDLLNMLNEPIIHWMEFCGKLVRIQLDGLAVFWIHNILISSTEASWITVEIRRWSTSILDSGVAPLAGRTNLFATESSLVDQKIFTGAGVGLVVSVPGTAMGIVPPQASNAIACSPSTNPFNWRQDSKNALWSPGGVA